MVDQTSQFYAILTNVGAAKQANADALGIAWKITQMGVGDANGTDPTPNATQTSLINEWRRAPLNQLKVDDKNSAIIIAEQVIPADVGGKWIREIALYDADGDMVAVANCAPTYKPLLSQGSGRTQVVRMNLVVSSASNVQLKIDPAVVLATREWVTEELARQDFKHSVLAATTANINLSGLQTIDGVALVKGARVLVKNQMVPKDNGIYEAAAGEWSRSSDADTDAKVTPGLLIVVERGVANSDSAWQLVSDGPINVGVSAQAYEMAFGRSGITAGTYRSVTVDKYGRVIAATNPTTVAGYGLTDVLTASQVNSALSLKSNLASPVFTGIPSGPTAAPDDSSTQLATTEFVKQLGLNLPSIGAGLSDGQTLSQAHAGKYSTMAGVGSWVGTLYLPESGISKGSVFIVSVGSGYGTLTVNAPRSGKGYIAVGSTPYAAVTVTHLDPPLILTCISDGIYALVAGGAMSATSVHFPFRGRALYTKAGTYQWQVPANVTRVLVDIRGAGGSGAFGPAETGAGGGGGGGICNRICLVTPGTSITVTVGAGGKAVSVLNTVGFSGGTSSFGAFCSSTGGEGGTLFNGAGGGMGVGGDFNASLGAGSPPVRNTNNSGAWGGPGGGGESIYAASDFSTPTQPGMGGAGRTISSSQPGADGCVFITY
ncbi:MULTISPECIES: phage tail protein [unclassified Pseudomonas]|uniref:phage tail protein n=1 Tax=unclassified Pseudomonas TaxID=196821 RepID=UPI000A0841F7|nr:MULTISPECIES: phage tail protein [unclassified Pseudomonas]RAS33050.1 tail-collar fiber protein [Pseudomonas sp. URMO17WK12:I7]SME95268.1 Phage-related tail fibre protein [Pseudomonas sp. URMO17WK12:I5]